ncbi:MAG: 16S rRNA (uracil(1498)-N(3))-methyltransferase [Acidobacteriota bacterium]|nr:16S rRNA (uracil(1498)-N(3))-methyltransferase [Acidobacteriota bacterium]
MNLVLLSDRDFVAPDHVRLEGRRLVHVKEIHRAALGDSLTVGVVNGRMGRGVVTRLDHTALEMDVALEREPPPKLPLTLILALPRPKVLNRALAAATSLGAARIVLLNAWKVEKSYWKSPRLSDENLLLQRVLGLEQARDTGLPELRLARFFRPFVEDELPALVKGTLPLVAHPGSTEPCPRDVARPTTLAIGPEGGWVEAELQSLMASGFKAVDLGPRILRVETVLASLVGRLF